MLSLRMVVTDEECRVQEFVGVRKPELALHEGGKGRRTCEKLAKGAASLTMPAHRHGDLVVLSELVGTEFDIPPKRFFGDHRHHQVMKAKRFFCLFAHEACGVPYPRLSQFLRLSTDGARKLALGIWVSMDESSIVDVWPRLVAAYRSRQGHLAIVQGETKE